MKKNRTLLVGLGKSGYATARYLKRCGAAFSVFDTRKDVPNIKQFKEEFPEIEVFLEDFNTNKIADFTQAIVSPGLSLKHPTIEYLAKCGLKILGDVELFLQNSKAPICAITGSNAKSTVTMLVTQMAQTANMAVKMGGNIGTPVLDLLIDDPVELYVLELSSFQLETIDSLQAKAATILNISPDHMDRYETLDDYISAKQRIYKNAQTAVINLDDEATYVVNNKVGKTLSFSLGKNPNGFGLFEDKERKYLAYLGEPLLDTQLLYLNGQHHFANALAALALGMAMDIPLNAMLKTLKNFKGLPHRCQLIKEKSGVKWFNDSKGTNEGASKAAIESIANSITGKVILIAGGQAKGSHFELLTPVVEKHIGSAILMGEAQQQLQNLWQKNVSTYNVNSMDEAVKTALKISEPGDAVLLSPACASFDMFANFEARGIAFERAVDEYIK